MMHYDTSLKRQRRTGRFLRLRFRLVCLAIALAGVNFSGCAAWYRLTRPVNEALQAPFIEMPGEYEAEKPPLGGTSKPSANQSPIIRSQSPNESGPYGGYSGRGPMQPSDATGGGTPATPVNRYTQPSPFAQPAQPAPVEGNVEAFQPGLPPAPPADAYPPGGFGNGSPLIDDPLNSPQTIEEALTRPTDLDIFVEEARTGRFSFGVAVNSNAGLTGQITVEERNFDIFRLPRSWDDLISGGAFRGGGQYLRMEAYPGNRFQRYTISLAEPYLFGTNITGSVSGSYFDRNYFDYFESRAGGTLGLGYRLTPDLSFQSRVRLDSVTISDPRVAGVPELVNVLGQSDLYGARFQLLHDTRDLPLAPTEGHYFDISYEQVFGSFDFPRTELHYSQYFMLRERPDGSGRHVLAFSTQLGFLGSDAPIFENFFAGGYNTIRGFNFRGASPINMGVRVGGHFNFINSVEYFFPLTADDMIKGVVFCDFGAVERNVSFSDPIRVAPGAGLRINVPALGPAPLALDFAFPLNELGTDDTQTFSFFFGVSRQ